MTNLVKETTPLQAAVEKYPYACGTLERRWKQEDWLWLEGFAHALFAMAEERDDILEFSFLDQMAFHRRLHG